MTSADGEPTDGRIVRDGRGMGLGRRGMAVVKALVLREFRQRGVAGWAADASANTIQHLAGDGKSARREMPMVGWSLGPGRHRQDQRGRHSPGAWKSRSTRCSGRDARESGRLRRKRGRSHPSPLGWLWSHRFTLGTCRACRRSIPPRRSRGISGSQLVEANDQQVMQCGAPFTELRPAPGVGAASLSTGVAAGVRRAGRMASNT